MNHDKGKRLKDYLRLTKGFTIVLEKGVQVSGKKDPSNDLSI